MSTINILIVDDHQMFIDGIKLLLKNNHSIHVVGEALNGIEALEKIKTLQVDIVLTDIEMPEMNGIELTKVIKKEYPEIKVLVLTMYNDAAIINEIIDCEAEGYILKNTGKQELTHAIAKVNDNGTHYSKEVVSILIEQKNIKQRIEDKTKVLSEREKEVIKLICQELTTPEIAEKLFLSPLTVETHRKNISKKLGIRTLVGLIKYAIDNKLD